MRIVDTGRGPPGAVMCWAVLGAALACMLSASGCRERERLRPPERPNIVLITVDTLRADRVSAYFGALDSLLAPLLRLTGEKGIVARALDAVGYSPKYPTPNIDGLARDGVLFESAYCDVSWTTPSMASTLTGTYALRHGLRANVHRLSESRVTIAEILGAQGYQTAAVIGSYPLDSVYGLDQGFDVYDDEYTVPLFRNFREDGPKKGSENGRGPQAALASGVKTDSEVTAAAIRLAQSFGRRDAPFFLWVHYFGPHSVNYEDLDILENERLHVATYSKKTAATDRALGPLLAFLDDEGLKDETLVLFHSDHGESLWEHGDVGHGRYLYEDNLRVPLVMRWPALIPRGKKVGSMVANIDIAATVLEAAGIDVSELGLDGRSFLGVTQKDAGIRDGIYIETYLPAHPPFAEPVAVPGGATVQVGVRRYGVVGDGWKYVVTQPHPLYGRPGHKVPLGLARRFQSTELYDLEADPGEVNNLVRTAPGIASRYARTLADYLAIEEGPAVAKWLQPSAEHVEKLRALGYLD